MAPQGQSEDSYKAGFCVVLFVWVISVAVILWFRKVCLKRENERLGKEKKDLQKENDILKREKERLIREKEDLQKQNETLKQEKENVDAEKEDLQKNYDRSKRENKRLGKENENLQKNYDILKREKERLVKEKENLQKENDTLKQEKEKVEAEKEDLQMKYESLKREKEKVEADFKDLRRNTNTCGYALGREWKKMTEARVNVTLDPDTASPCLTVSEDGSRVRCTGEGSAEWPSVLGREGFTSGRHYWEVEVGEKNNWVLGVSTHPDEKSIPEKPEEGYWLVRRAKKMSSKSYTAVSQSGHQILKLEVCKVWGVYLDWKEGRLSFYNAETKVHIHTFEGSFPGQVYPIFSPGSNGSRSLIIH